MECFPVILKSWSNQKKGGTDHRGFAALAIAFNLESDRGLPLPTLWR